MESIADKYLVKKYQNIKSTNDMQNMDRIEEKTSNNKIIEVEIDKLVSYRKQQPFSMYSENKKKEVKESIKENGILVPIIVRPQENSKYEIISGHNRVQCCKELGYSTIPAQIVNCDDNRATLIMLDTNLCNRDKIPPVEKGYAYKMKKEILKNDPNISNINEYNDNSPGENNESIAQIYRYIRLTELIKPIQEKVNNEILSIKAGAEISYLLQEEQEIVNQVIDDEKIKVNLAQAQKIRLKKNSINYEIALKILKNQKIAEPKFTGKVDKKIIKAYQNRFNSNKEFNELLIKLLEEYFTSNSE